MSQITNQIERTAHARRIWAVLLILIAAVLALGLVAPWIDAAAFSRPVQRAVENSLGRKIHFDKVHLTLFSGPGFALDDVSIAEDPRYGLEPFAWVPTLRVRLRIDKLLCGKFALSSLSLEDPSLNLVKQSDGTWNVVDLVQRLSGSGRSPLNLFPAFQVSDGRIDFKVGARKTTFYLLDADLSVYPERSGKLFVQFSGSPARTDRAGNGFGHLRGSANWFLKPTGGRNANDIQANLTLEPSNLSEITTLLEGEDLGVHGSISGRAQIAGPVDALRVSGELLLGDVHRWDLLPSSGEDWRIAYSGAIDWAAHRLNIRTGPERPGETVPVALELNVDNFLTRPDWSLMARLDHAPLEKLLPLCRRMGLSLPDDVKVAGAVEGIVSYSNSAGLGGSISMTDATATLANVPPLHAQTVNATVFADRIHFDPAVIDTPEGNLSASGDYFFSNQQSIASLTLSNFSVNALKSTVNAWFGTPAVLTILNGGFIEGTFNYAHQQTAPPQWSGQFAFTDATIRPEGIAIPLENAEAVVAFDAKNLQVTHLAAKLGQTEIRGSYRYLATARRPERLHIEVPAGDLTDIERALDPALTPQDLLARLHVRKRTLPAWLGARNMEGDIAVSAFSIDGKALGPMTSRFVWQGANLQLPSVQINLPEGLIRGRGLINMASNTPRCRFTAQVSGFPWRGGVLSAGGTFDTSGTGADSLQNLRATGSFAGTDVDLSADDTFSRISGQFEFSFKQGWPDLRFSDIEASEGLDAWDGNASTQSDGKLILELQHAGRQRRVVSTLIPETASTVSSLAPVRGQSLR